MIKNGYSLNDDSIGVVFNDLTNLLLLVDGANIQSDGQLLSGASNATVFKIFLPITPSIYANTPAHNYSL